MRKLLGSTLALGLLLGMAQPAQAGEVTRVATAFEKENRFDFHFGVAYDYNFKRAAILREWNTGAPNDQENRLVKDLIFQQQRHIVTPSLEFGFWHDFSVYAALPIVAYDQSMYAFDQRTPTASTRTTAPRSATASCRATASTPPTRAIRSASSRARIPSASSPAPCGAASTSSTWG